MILQGSDKDGGGQKRLRVLVVCPDCPSAPQFGPNIRSIAIARELARHFCVTLALRRPEHLPERPPAMPEGVHSWFWWDRASIARQMGSFDLVLSQGLQYPARAAAFYRGVQVFDLCTPVVFEQLCAGQHPGEIRHLQRLTHFLLRRGDLFLCASPQQRDLWMGALYASRLVRGEEPQVMRRRVALVPFGHDGSRPVHTPAGPVLKGVVPGIEEKDSVLLWGGGVWNWFDPLTLVQAMEEIQGERQDVKLYFLGTRFPNRTFDEYAMLDRTRKLAVERGLLGKSVFFHEGCVEFERRADYLLESDLAVCTAPDSLENEYAFRTRLVDGVWAGVPIVCTRGGVMSDYVEQNAIGLAVRCADVQELKASILQALQPRAQAMFRANLEACREELRWERCVRPLVEFCRRIQGEPPALRAGSLAQRCVDYLGYKLPSLCEKSLGF